MTKRYNSVPAKDLFSDLTSVGTNFKLKDIEDWGGNDLTAAAFSDTYTWVTLINDARTLVEFMLVVTATIPNATTTGIDIYKRGFKYYADGTVNDEDEVVANKLSWTSGETKVLLGTNPPIMYGGLLNKENDQTITGKFTFPEGGDANAPVSGTSYVAPTDDLEYASKKYVDDTAISGSPDATETVKGIIEIATTAEIDAGTATGATGASLGTRPDNLATSIYGVQLPTSDEKDALAGTSGTPSSSNEYVTDDDTAVAATANKVARRNATGDVTVNTTPTAGDDAASKDYADSNITNLENSWLTLWKSFKGTDNFTYIAPSVVAGDIGSLIASDDGSSTLTSYKNGYTVVGNTNTSDDGISIYLTADDFLDGIDMAQDFEVGCRGFLTERNAWTASQNGSFFWVGFANLADGASFNDKADLTTVDHAGLFIEYTNGTGWTAYMKTGDGSSTTETSLGTGFAPTSVQTFKVTFDGTTVEFFIDGASEGTLTTTLPDAVVTSGAKVLFRAFCEAAISNKTLDAEFQNTYAIATVTTIT